MAKKKSRTDESYVFFDIIYEDGARSSRRKVSAAELAEGDGDDHAKTVIMAQDRKIAEKLLLFAGYQVPTYPTSRCFLPI